ncbi:MAG: hypothetical protein AB2A00_36150 [Myxococcota bacterium]
MCYIVDMVRTLRFALPFLALLPSVMACSPTGGTNDGGTTTAQCTLQAGCGPDEVCASGTCQPALPCIDGNDWPLCVEWLEELQPGFGRRAACVEEKCQVMCNLDEECGAGRVCTDYGMCRPHTPSSAPKPGEGTRRALKAGLGREPLDFPTGVPLGGFSTRVDGSETRYGGGLSASVGQMDVLEARALLLDNGEHPLLIIRLPLIFIDMSFHEAVARILEEETGRDWRDQLVVNATHTHSAPGRLWPITAETVLPLGLFGIGDYSQQIYQRLIRSAARAALAAIHDTWDARVGVQIVESFDVDDAVAHDRRGATPPFDDNRVLLIRVDDATGPRVVLFSFGMHGTDNGSDYVTGDVLAGAEQGIEAAMSQQYGRTVFGMYVNQNSGTMAPSGVGHGVPQSFERMGIAFAQRVMEPLTTMTTSADVALDSRTTRFPITYELLGYQPKEWFGEADLPFGGEFYYGGVNCFGNWEGASDYSDYLAPDERNCFGVHTLLFNRPPTLLMRSQITALKLGDVTVVTMPGELSMELSWQVLRELQDRHGVDPLKAWTWGYSQDHQLYLLPNKLGGRMPPFPGVSLEKAPGEYPEYAFSYLRGDYESSLVHWGERSGDYLVEKAVAAYARLVDRNAQLPHTEAAPLAYSLIEEEPFPTDLSDPTRVGTVITELPETVARLQVVEFAWVGGDPNAEAPQTPLVTLERENPDGSFSSVMLPSALPYDNRASRFMTRVRKRDEDWQWVTRWEELKDFQTGNYRLRVVGHFQQTAGEGGRKEYTVTSRTFALVGTEMDVTAALDGNTLRGTVAYPAGTTLQFSRRVDDPGAVNGNFRMRHPSVPVDQPGPLEIDVDLETNGVVVRFIQDANVVAEVNEVTLTTEGNATRWEVNVPQTVPSGSYVVDVTVTDVHGNVGTWSATVDL